MRLCTGTGYCKPFEHKTQVMKKNYSYLLLAVVLAGCLATMSCSNNPARDGTDSTGNAAKSTGMKMDSSTTSLKPSTSKPAWAPDIHNEMWVVLEKLQRYGEALRDALRVSGVATDYKLYSGVTHEFFGMGAVVPDAKDAENYAAAALKKILFQ